MVDSGYTVPHTTNRTAAMTEPQTEAGKALMRFMGWGPAWAKKILAIEREAAALVPQQDRAAPRTEAAVSEFVSFEGTPEEHQRARAMAARFAGDRDRREAELRRQIEALADEMDAEDRMTGRGMGEFADELRLLAAPGQAGQAGPT